jgi:uncharacterized protein YjbI with pentapeptide repeats
MVDSALLRILKDGAHRWNSWRRQDLHSPIDLRRAPLNATNLEGADLSRANLQDADLSRANLSRANLGSANLRSANLEGADLSMANLQNADLSRANLENANLSGADLRAAKLSWASLVRATLVETKLSGGSLTGADLHKANISRADLSGAELRGANLEGANLSFSQLAGADLSEADISNCYVYGSSAWDVHLRDTKQSGLIITAPWSAPEITVDNVEFAHFTYLLLNSEKIRSAVDSITLKAVLVLGRFTAERKPILDSIRNQLRMRDYVPMLLDFEKPQSRDLTETISTLAHLSRFIIADLTGARSLPQELASIVPSLPSVPIVPILHREERERPMLEYFSRYPWVLPVVLYNDLTDLNDTLGEQILPKAEARLREIRGSPEIERP